MRWGPLSQGCGINGGKVIGQKSDMGRQEQAAGGSSFSIYHVGYQKSLGWDKRFHPIAQRKVMQTCAECPNREWQFDRALEIPVDHLKVFPRGLFVPFTRKILLTVARGRVGFL